MRRGGEPNAHRTSKPLSHWSHLGGTVTVPRKEWCLRRGTGLDGLCSPREVPGWGSLVGSPSVPTPAHVESSVMAPAPSLSQRPWHTCSCPEMPPNAYNGVWAEETVGPKAQHVKWPVVAAALHMPVQGGTRNRLTGQQLPRLWLRASAEPGHQVPCLPCRPTQGKGWSRREKSHGQQAAR